MKESNSPSTSKKNKLSPSKHISNPPFKIINKNKVSNTPKFNSSSESKMTFTVLNENNCNININNNANNENINSNAKFIVYKNKIDENKTKVGTESNKAITSLLTQSININTNNGNTNEDIISFSPNNSSSKPKKDSRKESKKDHSKERFRDSSKSKSPKIIKNIFNNTASPNGILTTTILNQPASEANSRLPLQQQCSANTVQGLSSLGSISSNLQNSLKFKTTQQTEGGPFIGGPLFEPKVVYFDDSSESYHKEFTEIIKRKEYRLVLIAKDQQMKIRIFEEGLIFEESYSYYEKSFDIDQLREKGRFFQVAKNVYEAAKKIEKLIDKKMIILEEKGENQTFVITLNTDLDKGETKESIELILTKKECTKEHVLKVLSKHVYSMYNDFNKRLQNLEIENQKLNYKLIELLNYINKKIIENNFNINLYNNNGGNNNNLSNMNNNNLINKNLFNSAFSTINNNIQNNSNNLNNNNDSAISSSISFGNINTLNNHVATPSYAYPPSPRKLLHQKRKRETSTGTIPPVSSSPISQPNSSLALPSKVPSNITTRKDTVSLFDLRHGVLPEVRELLAVFKDGEELSLVLEAVARRARRELRERWRDEEAERRVRIGVGLLFDSLTDGDRAKTFHEKCDYKRNTLTVLETTKEQRFGGYTSEYFESPSTWFDKSDLSAFVFSLNNKKVYNVIKNSPAISCDKDYGPYFRDDHICIVDNFLSNESGTCTKGKNFTTTKNYELNGGKKYFLVKRLQVFRVKVEKIVDE